MGLAKAVNKVEINGETVLDLTNDTVTKSNLPKGITAHNAAGLTITGEAEFVSSPSIQTIVVSNSIPTVDDRTVLTLVLTE